MAIVVVGAWIANWAVARFSPPDLVSSDVETAIDPAFLAPDELERLISTYEERTTEVSTPSDFLNLGQLYLEQARLTGDPARYLQAEQSFAMAAELSPQDPSPVVGLARTELALHNFSAAAASARGVLAEIPTRFDALAVVADAEMAIGNEEPAANAIDRLTSEVGDLPPVMVRRAQLAWLQGRLDESLDLALSAIPSNESNPRRLAFYEAYASHSAFQVGDLNRARELAEAALGHDSTSITALTMSARIAASDGDMDRAISLLEDAVAKVPDPELNGELGDLYRAIGDEAAAEEQFGLVGVIGTLAESQGVFNRQVARFYADHDLEHERALRLATDELEVRRDPLGYDTHAWALYRTGRFEEALAAIDQAQAGGFQDAEMSYHEGLIAVALGDGDRARQSLDQALELNPYFDLRGAADAERLLAELN